MPEAAASELVYVGQARPPSWREKAGRFIKEKIIDPHTPEAHYQDIIKKYFWVTDRLEGPSLELAQRLRPQVELAAKAAGWTKTGMELFFAGQASILMAFLSYRGLKSAFGRSQANKLSRWELFVARHRLKILGEPSVMLGDGRILSNENGTISVLPSHPALLEKIFDFDAYYPSLPSDEQAYIKARAETIRALRRKGVSKETTDLRKIRMELSKKHQVIFRRAFTWFRDRYRSNLTTWNETIRNRVSQRRTDRKINPIIEIQNDVTPLDRMLPDAAYAFAKNFWRLVEDAGGEEAYRQRVNAIRPRATSPSDGMKALANAFMGELAALFPKGEQSGLSPFVYDLMNMEFPVGEHKTS